MSKVQDIDLHYVHTALNIICTSTVTLISGNILKLKLPRRIPLDVEIRKVRCMKTGKFTYCVTVFADNYKVKESALHLALDSQTAIVQLVGYIYRHVVCLFLQRRTPLPQSRTAPTYITKMWSPVRITVFAVQLATQTHIVTYKSIKVIPEGINKCTIKVAHLLEDATWNVHIQYMQRQIQLVKRKSELQRSTYTVPFPTEVNFLTTPGGFQWTGQTAVPLQDIARNLWILLTSIL